MSKITPTDKEVTFSDFNLEDRSVVSRTDLNGNITFVNRAFCELSGYDKSQLIGKSHSIVRHPDMPQKAFKDLWDTIQENKLWHGFVKNLRNDGSYYWVETFIEPLFDEDKKLGYMSARKPISQQDKDKYDSLYKEMKKGE